MQSRSWDRDKDYETLVKWWTQWEFGIVPKDKDYFLSDIFEQINEKASG